LISHLPEYYKALGGVGW